MKTEEKSPQKLTCTLEKSKVGVVAVLLVMTIAFVVLIFYMRGSSVVEPEVISESSLQDIINVSELSTFTAVYNGIAEVKNEKNEKQTDYYVSYEAKVKAGIDFSEVSIECDDKNKSIRIIVPDVYITDISVDIASLDYIFLNEKANRTAVSEQALKACEQDVEEESQQQQAIIDLAQENARNVLKALVLPFVEQNSPDYAIEIL